MIHYKFLIFGEKQLTVLKVSVWAIIQKYKCRLPGSVPPTKYSKTSRIYLILINKNAIKTSRIYLILINKKGHPLRVEDTYIWRALQGLSTETVYLRHSANAEDTILAGGSAASPKAPPYGSL